MTAPARFREAAFAPEPPVPLVREPEPAAAYPMDALGPLAPAVRAVERLTEAPAALCAGSVLAAAALACQPLADVRLLGGGTAPASLFILTVAASGERKSSADRLALRGVRAAEARWRLDYEAARDMWRRERDLWEARRKAALAMAKDDPDGARAALAALGPEPPPPLRPQVAVADATIEGIVRHLPELRPSLGLFSEEAAILLGGHSLREENRLAAYGALSAMWDGQPLDRWRAGDGVERHSGRRFSAHLMCQPEVAAKLLGDRLAVGQGVVARFLVAAPPSRIGARFATLEAGPDPAAEAEVARFAVRVQAIMQADLPLAPGRRNELDPPVLEPDREARAVLAAFAREVEAAQAEGGALAAARGFASKAAEHAARIAAVLALFADPGARAVPAEAMAGACGLAGWYAAEAARLAEAAPVAGRIADAERLRRWLAARPDEPFGLRDVVRAGPFKAADRAAAALRVLEEHGHVAALAPEPGRRAGRWRLVREAGGA